MVPFHLHYGLSRRQRFGADLYPWLPCLAACLGFTLGITFLSATVSRWFLPLLVLPPVVCRRFLALLLDLAVCPTRPAQIIADDCRLHFSTGGAWDSMPLDGIIQVYRSGNSWMVLHFSGPSLTIPIHAITADQIDYLKGFALRAARQRREVYEREKDLASRDCIAD